MALKRFNFLIKFPAFCICKFIPFQEEAKMSKKMSTNFQNFGAKFGSNGAKIQTAGERCNDPPLGGLAISVTLDIDWPN
jgi:hypothetical protein